MSLAVFHIFFIVVSILLALGAGLWGVGSYASQGGASALVFGLLSLAAVPVLTVYCVRVRAKLKALEA